MSRLYDLIIAREGVKQLAEARTQYAAGERLLKEYLAKWEPLRRLLGLKGAPALLEGAMVLQGQSSVNSLPVETTASVALPNEACAKPNLVITIRSHRWPDVVNRLEIPSRLEGYYYPERLGLLCTIWMEHYQRAAVEIAAAEQQVLGKIPWTPLS